jgi:hypothetical protein
MSSHEKSGRVQGIALGQSVAKAGHLEADIVAERRKGTLPLFFLSMESKGDEQSSPGRTVSMGIFVTR